MLCVISVAKSKPLLLLLHQNQQYNYKFRGPCLFFHSQRPIFTTKTYSQTMTMEEDEIFWLSCTQQPVSSTFGIGCFCFCFWIGLGLDQNHFTCNSMTFLWSLYVFLTFNCFCMLWLPLLIEWIELLCTGSVP